MTPLGGPEPPPGGFSLQRNLNCGQSSSTRDQPAKTGNTLDDRALIVCGEPMSPIWIILLVSVVAAPSLASAETMNFEQATAILGASCGKDIDDNCRGVNPTQTA